MGGRTNSSNSHQPTVGAFVHLLFFSSTHFFLSTKSLFPLLKVTTCETG